MPDAELDRAHGCGLCSAKGERHAPARALSVTSLISPVFVPSSSSTRAGICLIVSNSIRGNLCSKRFMHEYNRGGRFAHRCGVNSNRLVRHSYFNRPSIHQSTESIEFRPVLAVLRLALAVDRDLQGARGVSAGRLVRHPGRFRPSSIAISMPSTSSLINPTGKLATSRQHGSQESLSFCTSSNCKFSRPIFPYSIPVGSVRS